METSRRSLLTSLLAAPLAIFLSPFRESAAAARLWARAEAWNAEKAAVVENLRTLGRDLERPRTANPFNPLLRPGVHFTAKQKRMIREMTAVNKEAAATEIRAELDRQFGD